MLLFERMVIIGPGLIGGSLGLAVRRADLAGHVVGVGHRQVSIDKALAMGAIDSGSLDALEAVRGADLVIVCTAVGLIGRMIQNVADGLKPGGIVSDVGSAKALVVGRAEAVLPEGVHFVGAHPIAGSERRGIDIAQADLFADRLCVLTRNETTDEGALAKMKRLWTSVGARVRILTPERHDSILARTSHLPHAVAAVLLAALEDSDGPFVGSGFRDTTRIGSGDPGLWVDILLANRQGVLAALKGFNRRLGDLTRALAEDDADALGDFLARARNRRENELGHDAG